MGVSENDIAAFFAFINAHLPKAELAREKVEYFYAGLRPLVDDGSGDTYGASRRAELVDHGKDDGLDGLFSAIGGKWTTSRHLAETVVDRLVGKLGVKSRPCETGRSLLPGGRMTRFADFRQQHSADGDHLARLYGSRLPEMLALAREDPALRNPIAPTGDIGAQVLFAVREEMALTLEDVVMRRTGIGQFGHAGARSPGYRVATDGGRTPLDGGTLRARNRRARAMLPDPRGRMSAFVVVNPRSANGRTGREWSAIETALGRAYPHMSVAFTRARREATLLVRNALREGHHEIIAIGGDGTINEAVNGFFDANGPVAPMPCSAA